MSDKSPYLLTPEQRMMFTTIPDDLSRQAMTHYYTLQAEDWRFIARHRGPHNKLGVALQLCLLRYPGHTLTNMTAISERVVVYVAEQLGLPAAAFTEYGRTRPLTVNEHLGEIRQLYGYRACNERDTMAIFRYLLPLAMENDEVLPIVEAAMEWIRQHKRIAPPILVTEKVVWHVQRTARRRVYNRMTRHLSAAQKQALDELLKIQENTEGSTPLAWLRIPARNL